MPICETAIGKRRYSIRIQSTINAISDTHRKQQTHTHIDERDRVSIVEEINLRSMESPFADALVVVVSRCVSLVLFVAAFICQGRKCMGRYSIHVLRLEQSQCVKLTYAYLRCSAFAVLAF